MYQSSNFNVSFPHDLTRNPSRLIQWQYWWWFWFSSVFVLYYLLITRVVLKRSLKFRPKIVTSYRAHGRWGDIIVAVIPIFWCLNILSHSTLLLRMSEFQTETNIITIRVRGRQWYWVYKLELSNFFYLSNKKVVLNSNKHVSLASNFRSGSSDLFMRHQAYRQYWRNWFLNKNVFFYNQKMLSGEMVTPETNLNDFDVPNKIKSWNAKLTRIKAFWYLRSLDSNNAVYTLKNNRPSFTLVSSKTFSNELKHIVDSCVKHEVLQSLNTPRDFLLNHFQNILNSFKDDNTIDFNNENRFNMALKQIKLPRIFQTTNNFDKHYGLQNHLFLNNAQADQAQMDSLNFNKNNLYFLINLEKKILNKLLKELHKTFTSVYTPINSNFSNILNYQNGFTSVKESFRYTLDVKPKFGYVPVKISLRAASMYDPNVLKYTDILTFETETESEFKNLNTVFKYFMVLDQNRRVMNRFFKLQKIDISPRLEKIEAYLNKNSDITQVKPIFSVEKPSFDAILQYKDGEPFTVTGLNPTYNNNVVKSNLSFINAGNLDEIKTYDSDFFSPVKHNISTELSTPQSKIRSQSKLLFNQRLLHTTSVLVLPTKLNITVITNSYDVIHSWFIPGLGLKMDCVPGRSTHHTLFIDHPGLYYGQCAEICGRFHHHMPIKVAALHWEHFLLWWYHHSMNLGVHAFLKDFNKASIKEFKTNKVYPVTSRFTSQRPVI